MAERTGRRHFLSSTMLGTAGAGALPSLEEKALQAAVDRELKASEPHRPVYQGETLPCGKIGKLSIGRLLMGGNLIGGYAHSRDLLYVSRLLREYNSDSKIFETLELAEQSGINMAQVSLGRGDIVARYRKERGGKIQTMVCAARVPAGIGSHSLEMPIASEMNGLNPDYYVKTFHPDNYWSATPEDKREEWCWYNGSSPDHNRYHENIFDLHPEKTEAFMKSVPRPWVAFKVMAAGRNSMR